MKRILITRLGGIGDLMFIEPVVRAIHEKFHPCEIVFRTYLDFYSVLEYHPLISEIVCDTNDYYLGYCNDMKPTTSKYWRDVNSRFDIHFDFQGVIERGFDLDSETEQHVVHLFGKIADVEIKDVVPQVPYLKKYAPSYNIVAQLHSFGRDKCLHENQEVLDVLSKYDNVQFLGEEKIDYHVFVSTINNCNLFIGTESCGITIARALNKQAIGLYTNNVRKKKLSFDKTTSLTFNQIHKLEKSINTYELSTRT
jgi:ADP-heptose:LPS heptosyltransferase